MGESEDCIHVHWRPQHDCMRCSSNARAGCAHGISCNISKDFVESRVFNSRAIIHEFELGILMPLATVLFGICYYFVDYNITILVPTLC